jgi:hypothetical protein
MGREQGVKKLGGWRVVLLSRVVEEIDYTEVKIP